MAYLNYLLCNPFETISEGKFKVGSHVIDAQLSTKIRGLLSGIVGLGKVSKLKGLFCEELLKGLGNIPASQALEDFEDLKKAVWEPRYLGKRQKRVYETDFSIRTKKLRTDPSGNISEATVVMEGGESD